MANIKYGKYISVGSRYKEFPDRPPEAWILNVERTKWEPVSSADHAEESYEMTREEWEKEFPNAPPLPPIAFKMNFTD